MAKTDEKPLSPTDSEVLCQASPAFWAAKRWELKLQSGTFRFKNHEYLIEPIDGPRDRRMRARRRCYMKSPQGGFSIAEAIINLHGMRYGKYPQGILHLLPTKAAVEEFGKAKYGPLIAKNKEAIGKFVQSGIKGIDSSSLKKIGDSYLYLRSAMLSPDEEGDGKSSTALSSISVDKVDYDEIELMDNEAIAKANGRMAHSEVKEEVYIFNPGGEDSGGDLVWKQSDMRHWFRKCSCTGGDLSAWTCAELEFPNCVREFEDADEREREGKHRGYICCKKCGKELPFWAGPKTGMWIPQKPSITDFDGYRWSHLTSVYHDPIQILREFENPPYGNLGDVYRLRLGLPYSAAEDKLRPNVVLANCGPDPMQSRHGGPCAMGMDVGITKHIVIGNRTDKEKYEIIKVAQIRTFDEAYDLCKRFGVKRGVVDIRPYEDEARSFQKKCKQAGIIIHLCQYVDNATQEYVFNENTGIVKTYRTGIFDQSHRFLSNGSIALPRQCPAVEEFAQQCCNAEKYADKDRNGATVMRYRPCGDQKQGDHYRSATNYLLLAVPKIAMVKSRYTKTGKAEDCISQYAIV
jgi:hypothetical protein